MKNLLYIIIVIFTLGNTPIKAQDNGILLETIGVLSAQTLYLTYVSIGTLTDGHANGNYDDEFSKNALKEYQNMAVIAKDQLKKLLNSPAITGEDFIFIDEMASTLEILRAEAEGYASYIETGNVQYVDIYEKKRNEAWDKITKLLDLE